MQAEKVLSGDKCCCRLTAVILLTEALVPRLAGVVKRGVGVNTRVGAARFVSSLALRMGPDIRPSSGALIKVNI